MSLESATEAITRFLLADRPAVLRLKGTWGVGKTYLFKNCVRKINDNGSRVSSKRISYTSIFGVNDIEQIKSQIFESTVKIQDFNGDSRAPSEAHKALAKIEKTARQSLRSASHLAGVSRLESVVSLSSFMAIRNQIVCFDDIERLGRNADITEVLGLVSFLRDERNCKVIIIVNDDEIEGDNKEIFNRLVEKVIDQSVELKPYAEELCDLVLSNNNPNEILAREFILNLGIQNIRIITHIKSIIQEAEIILGDFHGNVLYQFVHSATLISFCMFQPTVAPSIDFVIGERSLFSWLGPEGDNRGDTKKKWDEILDNYGFSTADDFDQAIFYTIKQGYIDRAYLREYAQEKHNQAVASASQETLRQAWAKFHDSFANNEEEVVHSLKSVFYNLYPYINPTNLDGIVRLFRALDRSGEADEIIRFYVNNREQSVNLFDLNRQPFGGEIYDTEIVRRFQEKADSIRFRYSFEDGVKLLASDINRDALAVCASRTVDDFVRLLKEKSGEEFKTVVTGCLAFQRVANRDSDMESVNEKAIAALKQIGRESKINYLRVKKFGIYPGC